MNWGIILVKQGSSYDTHHDIDSVMKMAGPQYEQMYSSCTPKKCDGLPHAQMPEFLNALGHPKVI
jgi:hypothetical protein